MIADSIPIASPLDEALKQLCGDLAARANQLESSPEVWPHEQLKACADSGVFSWFVDRAYGGQSWSISNVLRAYVELSAACLTTTFVITQFAGASRRLATGENHRLAAAWLPDLALGKRFATVGISHLTTSRQHLGKPALEAHEESGGYRLEGFSPWVTGAQFADALVVGASLADGRQLLALVPTTAQGLEVAPCSSLVALTASQTGAVRFRQVWVPPDQVVAGPVPHVLSIGAGAGSGGLQTSALALGLSRAAVDFVQQESRDRSALHQPGNQLEGELQGLMTELFHLSSGDHAPGAEGQLRARANSLVLRSTHAALVAAKGAGFVHGHAAGRWCREALFFLVWSCPESVATANLCEFSGPR